MLSSCCSISGVGFSPRWISCWASPRSFSICCRSTTASRSSLSASLDRLSAWYSGLCPINRPSSFPFSSSIVSPFCPEEGLDAPREYETLATGEVQQHFDLSVPSVNCNHFRHGSRADRVDLEREPSIARDRARRLANQLARYRQSVFRAQQCHTRLPVANIGGQLADLGKADVRRVADDHVELLAAQRGKQRAVAEHDWRLQTLRETRGVGRCE